MGLCLGFWTLIYLQPRSCERDEDERSCGGGQSGRQWADDDLSLSLSFTKTQNIIVYNYDGLSWETQIVVYLGLCHGKIVMFCYIINIFRSFVT